MVNFSYLNSKKTKVIRGGDGSAGLAIRHPNGQLVKAYEWLPTSDYSEQSSTGGYYAICLDNQFSRFASKLVNIYITVIKYDQWTKYAQEIEELQLDMQNFTVNSKLLHRFFNVFSSCCFFLPFYSSFDYNFIQATIGTVERNLNGMLQYQSHSRSSEARDFALLIDNNSYVQNWSIIQISVILLTCSIQVSN